MTIGKILAKLGIVNVVSVSPDNTVEMALKLLDEKGLRAAPVVDGSGQFLGMFSAHDVIKELIPSYLDGVGTLDFAQGASPILAGRLQKLFPSRVGDHVSAASAIKITTHTNTWEALRMLTKYGSPIAVVDDETGMFKGLISEQSAIEALLKIHAEDD